MAGWFSISISYLWNFNQNRKDVGFTTELKSHIDCEAKKIICSFAQYYCKTTSFLYLKYLIRVGSRSFTSIYPTYPRINPWNFCEKMLRISSFWVNHFGFFSIHPHKNQSKFALVSSCFCLRANISVPSVHGVIIAKKYRLLILEYKVLSETKVTKLGVGRLRSISGRFSANYINSFHKTEFLKVILMG